MIRDVDIVSIVVKVLFLTWAVIVIRQFWKYRKRASDLDDLHLINSEHFDRLRILRRQFIRKGMISLLIISLTLLTLSMLRGIGYI